MNSQRQIVIVLLMLLAIRLVAMHFIPLNETTEARYGEIARKMLETGNWVTLLHDYDIPFLAKPPLSTWLSAGSMGVFGVNEFAARLPSLLLSFGVLALTGFSGGAAAALVLASSAGFFVAAGSVMTDPALLFCTTLIMVSFWQALHSRHRLWGYLFFAGCGLGLLAKGPVALVLTGVPIFLWVVVQRQWRTLWQRLPWMTGCVLTLAIALPWYLLAELRTPGFLRYFIIGENLGRFLDPHWKGDQYGFAHAYPYGMIWLFTLAGLFPWSIAAPGWAWRRRGGLKNLGHDDNGRLFYLILWVVAPLLFFTFSANIIWPYCLTVLPGFALLFAELRGRAGDGKAAPALAMIAVVLGIFSIVAFAFYPEKVGQNQKDIVAAWQAEKPDSGSAFLFWGTRMEFSAAFYSGGRAISTHDPVSVGALLHNKTRDYIVVNDYNLEGLPPEIRRAFSETGRFRNGRGTRILLRESAAAGKKSHDD